MTLQTRQRVRGVLESNGFTVCKVSLSSESEEATAAIRTTYVSPTNWACTVVVVDWVLETLDHKLHVLSAAPIIESKRLLDSMVCGTCGSVDFRRAIQQAWDELLDVRF